MINFFLQIFNVFLYQPLLNTLILLYEFLPGHDFGIAIIVLTVGVRIALYPLMAQSIKSQKVLSELQPKLLEIQRKYKNDREKQAQAIVELYRKEKINPLAGFLPLFIQLPILIALYRVFWKGVQSYEISHLYSFVPSPGLIDSSFLGIINLGQSSFILAVLAGVLQFLQTKMIDFQPKQPKEDSQMGRLSKMVQKQTLYFLPIFTVLILWRLPGAVGLYWAVSSLFSIFQQYIIIKKENKT